VGLARAPQQQRAYARGLRLSFEENADLQQPGRADGAANAPAPTQGDAKAADTANVGARRHTFTFKKRSLYRSLYQ
jgi:hypothetical protein